MKPFEKSVAYIEKCVERGDVCSAALAIGIGEKVYIKRCFGNTSFTPEATPVNETTIYDMASVSKILSKTMIALRLISKGVIDLADTLERHFGSDIPDDKKGIQIYHLMTHTGGFVDHMWIEHKTDDRAKALEAILNEPLAYPTGTDVKYSCIGYIVLGFLLEKVTGKSLDELSKEEVFEPLEMTSTGYHPLDKPINKENTCYTEKNHLTGEWLVGEVHDENAYFLNGVAGNAGIFSNLNDMIRFAKMLAGHGTLEGKKYLPRCIFDTAIQCYTEGLEDRRGLGFHLAGGFYSMSGQFFSQKGFGHNGFTGPHVFVDPDTGLWVTMLTNRVHPTRENSNHLRMRRILHTLLTIEFEEFTDQ